MWQSFLNHALPIANSPIFIAVLTLAFGALAASRVTFAYQRRQQIFQIRVAGVKDLLDAHARLMHLYMTVQEQEHHEAWMRLLTTIRYARMLLPSSEMEANFQGYQLAWSELNERMSIRFDAESIKKENETILAVLERLNGVMRGLTAKLGIKAKD